MLQRTALRGSNALRSSLRPSTPLSSPRRLLLSRPQYRIQPLSVSSRWHSEAATQQSKPEGGSAAPESKATAGEKPPEEASKAQLEAKDKEIADLKDRYLRSVADFRNLQERTKREVQAARDFALQPFAKDLLDSVDNLERALATVTPAQLEPGSGSAAQDLAALHGGLRMTETLLLDALRKHGLERFDPAANGDKFDANRHEALFMAPQPGKDDGAVFHTQQKGFTLNGRTIRAAKVGVVRNS